MTDVDFVAITGFISGAFIGGVACVLWERHGWIKALLKRKLIRYGSKDGKLLFFDGGDLP